MERDDIVEYSLDNHHSEEEGKKIRKKIFKVTIILTLITALEIGFGIAYPKSEYGSADFWVLVKWGYVVLTIWKAYFIVKVFMHLGDERRDFKLFVLVPYTVFIIYLIWLVLLESTKIQEIWMTAFN